MILDLETRRDEVLLRTAISIALLALGPGILVVVVAATLFRNRVKPSGDAERKSEARIIVAAALTAAAFVTIGVLIYWRLP